MEGARASAKAARGEFFPKEPRGTEVMDCSAWDGEADKEGLLKGINETEGLLPTPEALSVERRDDLDPCADRLLSGGFLGSDSSGLTDPAARAARRADIGLVPVAGPI